MIIFHVELVLFEILINLSTIKEEKKSSRIIFHTLDYYDYCQRKNLIIFDTKKNHQKNLESIIVA